MERLFRSRVSAVHGIWSGQAFHVYLPSRKRREVGMERLIRPGVSDSRIWSGQAFHVYLPSRKRREVGMERLIRSGIVEGKEVCSVSASGQVL
jgi:hypothetical protein